MAVAIVLMIALIPWSKSSLVTVRNATSPCISSNPLDATPYQPCQSRIRLTPSFADSCGAVWSTQSVPVDSSFQITFSFQVSNITGYCPDHMNIYERCAKRGGHGLALIIQHDPSATNLASFIGGCQEGLGYTGIRNSVAIEFDMVLALQSIR
uniref:Uncharacterized protein n=1 Tax=Spongospora subterranea TaxID=70186 RepID=A0A0H5QQF2_9EUKA|eukprot:CRZ04295.1 hypothetical protein [Spongospora subterranea]